MSGGDIVADQLRLFIWRVERLTEEKKGLADDIKDVFSEAKAFGYDVPTMRKVIRLRAMDPHARQQEQALLETYLAVLDMG